MKSFLVVLTIAFSLSTQAYCPHYFQSESLCGELKWVQGPLLNKKSHFLFKFWKEGDREQTSVSPSTEVKIYSWMTMANGHDHGGPKMTARETSPGIFEVRDARFFMHGMNGFWEIVVDLKNNNTVLDSTRYRVQFD